MAAGTEAAAEGVAPRPLVHTIYLVQVRWPTGHQELVKQVWRESTSTDVCNAAEDHLQTMFKGNVPRAFDQALTALRRCREKKGDDFQLVTGHGDGTTTLSKVRIDIVVPELQETTYCG